MQLLASEGGARAGGEGRDSLVPRSMRELRVGAIVGCYLECMFRLVCALFVGGCDCVDVCVFVCGDGWVCTHTRCIHRINVQLLFPSQSPEGGVS